MKSDETAYQELFEELEKYENKGVYISMDGFPASPMQIVAAHMTREEGSYMRDYILDITFICKYQDKRTGVDPLLRRTKRFKIFLKNV